MGPVPPGARPADRAVEVRAADGVAIRAGVWNPDGVRGLALLLPGRTEFLEKVALAACELAARGFAVVSLDWRGQGRSARLLPEPMKGHVGNFADYMLDLDAVLGAPEVAGLGPPMLIVGHSMGGSLALRAAERYGAGALVLSAPMFGIRLPVAAHLAAGVMVLASRLFGLGERWLPAPDPGKPYIVNAFDRNVLTGDEVLWAWLAETARTRPWAGLGAPTLGWIDAALAECARVARRPAPPVPTLVILGSRECVCDPAAIRGWAKRTGSRLVELEGARHDLFFETERLRAALWSEVDAHARRAGI